MDSRDVDSVKKKTRELSIKVSPEGELIFFSYRGLFGSQGVIKER